MGQYRQFRNGVHSMIALPKLLASDGCAVSPRGVPTLELRNVLIQIDDPSDVTMLGIGRKWSARIAVAEFLQLVGGFSDPQRMVEIAPNFKNFLNGGAFHGAYGPRISMQLQPLVDRLNRDPLTRQGVVTIWDPIHDLLQEFRRDLPCTLSFTFAIRHGKLEMSTHMRSNDVWWGWSYDLFQFTQLQWTVANLLELEAGPYIHYVDSLHMYERDMEAALNLTDPVVDRPRLFGIGRPHDADWRTIQDVAHELFYDPECDDMSPTEEWMYEVIRGTA